MTQVGSYTLKGNLSAHNAGFSRWGKCVKGNHAYFIKEFLSPVWPPESEGLPAAILERKRGICREFYNERKKFYEVLARCRTGNVIVVEDFFRYGTKFYAVSDWVQASGISCEEVSRLDPSKKALLMRSLLYSVSALHAQRIVHADLKLDNLLLKTTKRDCVTAKIIDFDAGFLEGQKQRDVQGDFVYLAPETYLRMQGEPIELTRGIDMFALGLIIHQLWSGSLPYMGAQHRYAFEAVLDDAPIALDASMPLWMKDALQRMLSKQAHMRPDATSVLRLFEKNDIKENR